MLQVNTVDCRGPWKQWGAGLMALSLGAGAFACSADLAGNAVTTSKTAQATSEFEEAGFHFDEESTSTLDDLDGVEANLAVALRSLFPAHVVPDFVSDDPIETVQAAMVAADEEKQAAVLDALTEATSVLSKLRVTRRKRVQHRDSKEVLKALVSRRATADGDQDPMPKGWAKSAKAWILLDGMPSAGSSTSGSSTSGSSTSGSSTSSRAEGQAPLYDQVRYQMRVSLGNKKLDRYSDECRFEDHCFAQEEITVGNDAEGVKEYLQWRDALLTKWVGDTEFFDSWLELPQWLSKAMKRVTRVLGLVLSTALMAAGTYLVVGGVLTAPVVGAAVFAALGLAMAFGGAKLAFRKLPVFGDVGAGTWRAALSKMSNEVELFPKLEGESANVSTE